jgi:tetratricopeptide (TPR) repeat protein
LAIVELKSDDYLNIVWNAAESYQKANQVDSANRMLKTYLQYETRSRQPRALIAIGKNYIARGDWRASAEPLQRCLDYYPNSPSCYEVRLLLARANAEQNNLDAAIDLLSENLWEHDLSPASPIWQDSSVELGNLIFQRGNRLLTSLKSNPPQDASEYSASLQTSHNDLVRGIEQLSEAVDRFPEDRRYFHTRYLLAHSYRLAAEMPKIIAATDSNMLDSARKQLNQQWRKLMESSVNEFRGLLAAIQNSAELDALAPAILRNCYFGEADALVTLGRHEEAIQAFKNAASYYVNQPEALEALVQLAECHKKLGRTKEAQRALRQAEQVLQRIPPDHEARFVSSTRGDRRHWQDLLGWMNKQYN